MRTRKTTWAHAINSSTRREFVGVREVRESFPRILKHFCCCSGSLLVVRARRDSAQEARSGSAALRATSRAARSERRAPHVRQAQVIHGCCVCIAVQHDARVEFGLLEQPRLLPAAEMTGAYLGFACGRFVGPVRTVKVNAPGHGSKNVPACHHLRQGERLRSIHGCTSLYYTSRRPRVGSRNRIESGAGTACVCTRLLSPERAGSTAPLDSPPMPSPSTLPSIRSGLGSAQTAEARPPATGRSSASDCDIRLLCLDGACQGQSPHLRGCAVQASDAVGDADLGGQKRCVRHLLGERHGSVPGVLRLRSEM